MTHQTLKLLNKKFSLLESHQNTKNIVIDSMQVDKVSQQLKTHSK